VKKEGTSTRDKTGSSFMYLDIGCNEGDLTVDVARALSTRLTNARAVKVGNTTTNGSLDCATLQMVATGVDLDPILIQRAKKKYDQTISSSQQKEEPVGNSSDHQTGVLLQPQFEVSNVLSETSTTDALKERYHLTSIFSTTMWVHIRKFYLYFCPGTCW
jgi:hypothetical protein